MLTVKMLVIHVAYIFLTNIDGIFHERYRLVLVSIARWQPYKSLLLRGDM